MQESRLIVMSAKIRSVCLAFLVSTNLLLAAMDRQKKLIYPSTPASSPTSSSSFYHKTYFFFLPDDIQNIIKMFLISQLASFYRPTLLVDRYDIINDLEITSVCMSANGHHSLLLSKDIVRVLSLRFTSASGDPTFNLRNLSEHTSRLANPCIAPDGKIAITCENSSIVVWNLEVEPYQRHVLTGHSGEISALYISPTERKLITGDSCGTAILWDLTDLNDPIKQDLSEYAEGSITSACISDDGKVGIIGSNIISIIDLEDPKDLPKPIKLNLHKGPIASVLISPNGKRAITSSIFHACNTPALLLWTLPDEESTPPDAELTVPEEVLLRPCRLHIKDESPERQKFLEKQLSESLASALTPNGRWLITTNGSETLILDLENPTAIRAILFPVEKHLGTITSVCIADRDKSVDSVATNDIRAIVGSRDGKILFYNLNDSSMYQFKAHKELHAVAMSRCGSWVITAGSEDRTPSTILWRLPSNLKLRNIIHLQAECKDGLFLPAYRTSSASTAYPARSAASAAYPAPEEKQEKKDDPSCTLQ